MVCPMLEVYEERAQLSLTSGPQRRKVIVPVKCMCNQKHSIWKCDMFKGRNIERSGRRRRNLDCVTVAWGKGNLVTHVLGVCGIDGCKDRHHRLLPEEKVASGSMEGKADTPMAVENKSSTYETVQEHAQRSIALRTVPVILKHGERRLQVNFSSPPPPSFFFALALIFARPKHRNLRGNPTETLATQAKGATAQFVCSSLGNIMPDRHKETYPLGANAVLEHCYMDDLMPSAPTVECGGNKKAA